MAAHAAASGTQAIGRAAALLRELAGNGGTEYSLADLARRLGLERPTAHRILRRLVDEQLVSQNPVTRGYSLGSLVYELGLVAKPSSLVRELCDRALTAIAEESGDTAFAFVASALDCVCYDRREGAFPVKGLVLDVGRRRPMGVGAGSLALLSALPEQEAQGIIQRNTQRLALAGEADLPGLLAKVDQGRETGYVVKSPVVERQVMSMGMAVRNAYGQPVLSFSVSTLSYRISRRQRDLVGLLKRETLRTEQQLARAGRA